MMSFGYRLNPRFAIKECLSCGALYTRDFCCLKGNVEDKILIPKPPKNRARCAKCGHPVNGPYCQGSTTTHSDISLPDYEAFYFDDDHIKEISSGSTTTHSDISISEYDSFVFDPLNDQFPPTDRSDLTHEEFADELVHVMSPPEYDCFYFWNLPDP
nr:hypothetical protein [Tanacetum cinerariifolium]